MNTNRIILVTGANRGIGLAIVEEMSRNSHDTILLGCRNLEEGKVLASKIGNNVKAEMIDLANRSELEKQINSIILKYHIVDVLINNAGILNEGRLEEITLQSFDESIRINATAPLELIKLILPLMRKNNYGRIVNISSGWGSFNEGLTGPCGYSISKAALNAITLNISKDLPQSIKINSMCPGWVRTRMGGDSAPRTPAQGAQTAVWLSNLESTGPTGKFFRDMKEINW